MNKRRGFTLIEVVTVIAAGAAMMGVALGLLHTLMQFERASREGIREWAACTRLAGQFRRDVHAADQWTTLNGPASEDSSPAWQLRLAEDRRVEYRVEQAELVRVERAGAEAVRQESFSLPADATVSIRRLGDAAPGLVRLEIAPGLTQAGAGRGAHFRVDALLAKDRRFAAQNEP